MIVKKQVTFSRKTGEIIKEEILEEDPKTKDQYWDPLIKLISESESFKNEILTN